MADANIASVGIALDAQQLLQGARQVREAFAGMEQGFEHVAFRQAWRNIRRWGSLLDRDAATLDGHGIS